MPFIRLAFVCLLPLFLAVSVQAQNPPGRMPSLNDIRTFDGVSYYLELELQRLLRSNLKDEEKIATAADLFLAASDRAFYFARSLREYGQAYETKLLGLDNLVKSWTAENAKENNARLKTELRKEFDRWAELIDEMLSRATPLDEEEIDERERNALKSEFAFWNGIPKRLASLAFEAAEKNKVPAEQVVKEWSEYIMSPEYELSAEKKKEIVASLEVAARLAYGGDPKLYGKTLDDKDFDWKSLREKKYVLIAFSSTFSDFLEIRGMLNAYEKYHDKGLEIVSIYSDPVATVKKHVEERNLRWIILSTELTVQAKQPAHMEFYGLAGVPQMFLLDKEGKVIMTKARGEALQTKLAEIFE